MPDPVTRLNAALEGRYRIESQLGEGGMATVYLARDEKHNRNVALKVLKPELAAVVGAERFLAEIKTTANLQHPHILPLFDSDEADTFLFYVMPYVEGESLRERLDREHQLPVDEAVQIAKNVAEALDYAHRHGVIHRDIKPANILLQDGKPVISDFGIALAVGTAGQGRLTETGLSLGTPHYMSPEQATGDLSVGATTDVYALGCVLYEMLVGEPPHTGSTAQAILGKIVVGDADPVTKHRKSVPANVDAAIRKSLEKVPADRFAGAQEFARALGDPAFRRGEVPTAGIAAGVGPWKRLTMTMTGVSALFALALGWSLVRLEPPASVARFPSPFLEGQGPIGPMELTPDGSALVYTGPGPSGAGSQLWIRRWENLGATPIPGTEGASLLGQLSLSPDGREVAFALGALGRGRLRVVPLEGGPSRTLVEGASGVGGWSEDGWVYFSSGRAIQRVPETGGEAEILTERRAGEVGHALPRLLPAGEAVVFQVLRVESMGGSEIWTLDLETGDREMLIRGNTPRYVPTGHLLFGSDDGRLMAARFDMEHLALTAPSVPVAEGLSNDARSMVYSVSQTGALMYRTAVGAAVNDLVWVSRTGVVELIDPTWDEVRFSFPALSPDGTRLAVNVRRAGVDDVWVKLLDRGPSLRLTLDSDGGHRPAWTHDGTAVTYFRGSGSYGGGDLDNAWTRRADGNAPASLELDEERGIHEMEWSRDGEWLVYRTQAGGGIYGRSPGIGTDSVMLVDTDASEFSPSLSPDGRFMAFTADETGRDEVYVIPFPNAGDARWVISPNGGTEVRWSATGQEIFYRDAAENMVAVPVTTEPSFSFDPPQVLFPAGDYLSARVHPQYDVDSNGQRFVMLRLPPLATVSGLILAQNWFTELCEQMGDC